MRMTDETFNGSDLKGMYVVCLIAPEMSKLAVEDVAI